MDKKISNTHNVAVHLLRAVSYAHDQVCVRVCVREREYPKGALAFYRERGKEREKN
jgi:hypothetical protein